MSDKKCLIKEFNKRGSPIATHYADTPAIARKIAKQIESTGNTVIIWGAESERNMFNKGTFNGRNMVYSTSRKEHVSKRPIRITRRVPRITPRTPRITPRTPRIM